MAKGPKMEFPVTGVKVVINDGACHAVDSSDMAFQQAARGAFHQGYSKAKPVIQEPIMKVVVETPTDLPGAGHGLAQPAARHDRRRPGRGRPVRDRVPGAAGRDVRLLNGAALPDPGPGPVHHGISGLPAGAAVHRRSSSKKRRPSKRKKWPDPCGATHPSGDVPAIGPARRRDEENPGGDDLYQGKVYSPC